MLVLIYGSKKSGKTTIHNHLVSINYTPIEYSPDIFKSLVAHKKWRSNCVSILPSIQDWLIYKKRPCARLLVVYSPSSSEWRHENDDLFYSQLLEYKDSIRILNFGTIDDLYRTIDRSIKKLRPDWDSYFLEVAHVISKRSNCMKGMVGCVLTKECRVISTGYNGTPTNVQNCYENGCVRCNSGCKNNEMLEYCLCIHAEENTLLYTSYEMSRGCTMYVTVFPCQLCCRKIVQMGVVRIVYLASYGASDCIVLKILEEAGIEIIKYDV